MLLFQFDLLQRN